jgi:hypothetical protein
LTGDCLFRRSSLIMPSVWQVVKGFYGEFFIFL